MSIGVEKTKTVTRGEIWFEALTQNFDRMHSPVASLRIAQGQLRQQNLSVFCIVADHENHFPRARSGEVGLLEGWALAEALEQVIEQDRDLVHKRGILCIVDVPSQAYGQREEVLGIHQALAGAVDRYVSARLAGHPVVSLLVGKAMSGAFLAHGYQANRILALKDAGVMVHAMGKESAARITLRSVEELEKLAAHNVPMAYDIESYHSLGLLSGLLEVSHAECPTTADVQYVEDNLSQAFQDIITEGSTGLSHRLKAQHRDMSVKVRALLREQWI